MLRARNLHETLQSVIGVDVTSAMLVTTSGGLLAAANVDPDKLRSKDHSLMVAVVVNLWRNYCHNNLTTSTTGSDSPQPENLEFVIVQLDARRLCLMGIGRAAVLCLESTLKTEAGLLKLKATSLHSCLEPQLKPVFQLLEKAGSGSI